MGKSREIKTRIKAVRNIQRITRTMQMIATSKFSRAQQAAVAGKPYADTLLDLVSEIAGGEGIEHPLLGSGRGEDSPTEAAGRELTLVITSERGLCGPYNGNIVRAAIGHLTATPAASDGRLEVIGKKGVALLRFSRFTVDEQLSIGDSPRYEEVERFAQRYIDAYTAGEYDAVRVVSMRYISAGRQVPQVLQLLPFAPGNASVAPAATPDGEPAEPSDREGVVAPYEFSPGADELLDSLLPMAVKALLFQIVNEAVVSDHIARMIAMKAATDNAGKMRKRLAREYNRARQGQITTELTEIISGAAALG